MRQVSETLGQEQEPNLD